MDRTPFFHILVLISFLANTLGPVPFVQAQEMRLPVPGIMVNLSPEFNPPVLKGVTVYPDNPFKFDFILDKGDPALSSPQGDLELKQESTKLVKYFLAAITTPEDDLWVNLSPYEKNRIIPQSFGQTDMGRDLLAEDYILKQLTASLIYPEKNLGREFWNRVYAKAQAEFGTTQIPVNTFNKVWILANQATVYEHNQTAFVISGHLKVMLDEDYLALQKHEKNMSPPNVSIGGPGHAIASQIIRQIILPEIEH